MKWKYKGGGFILPIPARDLTAAEGKLYGEELIIKSGLYEEIKPKYKPVETGKEEAQCQE